MFDFQRTKTTLRSCPGGAEEAEEERPLKRRKIDRKNTKIASQKLKKRKWEEANDEEAAAAEETKALLGDSKYGATK